MILALLVNFTFGQETKDKKGVTFAVSDVKPATALYPEIGYKDAVQQRVNAVIEGYPLSEADRKLIPVDVHGFVAALHIAFAQHRPMVISPDMIWLMIVQGATMHIQQNKEVLRDKIVAFQGKRSLNIIENSFRKGSLKNDWSNAFAQFSDSIKKQVSDSVYGLFVTSFSTTTPKEKSAFEIALMDGVDDYFDYSLNTECGIPNITLEGTPADWEWIAIHCSDLEYVGMKDWSNDLQPILNEFVKASKGEVDSMFWQSIYKWCNISGGSLITGWIVKFFPYIITDGKCIKNPLLEGDRFVYDGLKPSCLPSGLSKADFVWDYQVYKPAKQFKMNLYSGFFGISQNSVSKALRPEISWVVRDSASKVLKSKNENVNDETSMPFLEAIEQERSCIFSELLTLNAKMVARGEIYAKEDKKKTCRPILFPDKCKTYEEGIAALVAYLKAKISEDKVGFSGQVSFVITWSGVVDNVKIIKSDHPDLNGRIVSILEEIKGCAPGYYSNTVINTEILIDLNF